MIQVTVKYGLTRSLQTDVNEDATIRDIISNTNTRLALGYPENVSAVIDGVTVSLDDHPSEGDTVVLEKQAAAKAA